MQLARTTQNNDSKLRLLRTCLTTIKRFSNDFVGSFDNNYVSNFKGSYYASTIEQVVNIYLEDLPHQGLRQNTEYSGLVNSLEQLRTTAITNKNLCKERGW
jgi:hypothetical protein